MRWGLRTGAPCGGVPLSLLHLPSIPLILWCDGARNDQELQQHVSSLQSRDISSDKTKRERRLERISIRQFAQAREARADFETKYAVRIQSLFRMRQVSRRIRYGLSFLTLPLTVSSC